MGEEHKIIQNCKRCDGSGEENIGWDEDGNLFSPVTCRKCDGAGTISSNSLHADLIDLILDIQDKVIDIKQKVDAL